MNSTIARILCSGSGIALIRVLILAGKSKPWIGCVDIVDLSSTSFAFSNAVSKLRSASILLRFAISAIASRSGSRQVKAGDESRSVPWDTADRNFPQSHAITLMSCHKGLGCQRISPSRAVFGHLRLDAVLSMEESVRRADIPVQLSRL